MSHFCLKCHEIKPEYCFCRNNNVESGVNKICRKCAQIYSKEKIKCIICGCGSSKRTIDKHMKRFHAGIESENEEKFKLIFD